MEAARREGERALHAARDFTAAAEHELRTPLTALRTDLDVLAAHADLAADQRGDIVAALRASQQRVADTLGALAVLARGELAGGDLAGEGGRAAVDVTDLVAQAVAAAARAAPDGVQVRARLPEQEVWTTATASGLRLAVDNLLTNALRHAGGTVVEAAVNGTADRLLVTVDDDGAGVPPEEREAVFDRFRRGRSARGTGSGLGLALVAQQAALHGGRAYLSASPLGGTRAVLELPRDGVERPPFSSPR